MIVLHNFFCIGFAGHKMGLILTLNIFQKLIWAGLLQCYCLHLELFERDEAGRFPKNGYRFPKLIFAEDSDSNIKAS